MIAKTTDEHFAEYTQNNTVKHRIFSDYFGAYLQALGRQVKGFHYIDGFAGRGRYGDSGIGSPLLALERLGKQPLPFSISLVEASAPDHALLQKAFGEAVVPENMHGPPAIAKGSFSEHIDEILRRPIYGDFSPTATFALADPCGVSGLRAKDVAKVISMPFGECLLFWNYDGFNRLVGGVAKGTHPANVLIELLGDESFVAHAVRIFQTTGNIGQKERLMSDLLASALRAHTGATHVLPFRFRAEDSARTSHYLIHCSKSGLAFKIMKDVMQAVGTPDAPDLFEYSRESADRGQFELLQSHDTDEAVQAITQRLAKGRCKVSEITKEWPKRQADFLTEGTYRQILLDMEKRGLLVVMDKDGTAELSPGKRRRSGGEPTISPDLIVALSR
jgi:three-Cys-motif partner protein